MRRHAADVRIPYAIRVRLRDAAERALRRSASQDARGVVSGVDRRALLAASPIRLSHEDQIRGSRQAADAGLRGAEPLVVVEGVHRVAACTVAVALLREAGYQVARFRDDADAAFVREGVVDLPNGRRTPQLDAYLLATSAFVICCGAARQEAAQSRDIPVLRLDAREPFSAYPIRPNGLFTLATVVDLDTGRHLDLRELLAPGYYRNRRNCGYKATNPSELAAAITEMIDGVRNGWHDTDAQARFRDAVAAAGTALAGDVPELVEWDAAAGFIGAGRLAGVQAERAL